MIDRVATGQKNLRDVQSEERFLKTPGEAGQAKRAARPPHTTNICTQASYGAVLREAYEQKTKRN